MEIHVVDDGSFHKYDLENAFQVAMFKNIIM